MFSFYISQHFLQLMCTFFYTKYILIIYRHTVCGKTRLIRAISCPLETFSTLVLSWRLDLFSWINWKGSSFFRMIKMGNCGLQKFQIPFTFQLFRSSKINIYPIIMWSRIILFISVRGWTLKYRSLTTVWHYSLDMGHVMRFRTPCLMVYPSESNRKASITKYFFKCDKRQMSWSSSSHTTNQSPQLLHSSTPHIICPLDEKHLNCTWHVLS